MADTTNTTNIQDKLTSEQVNRTIAEVERDNATQVAAEQAVERQEAEANAINANLAADQAQSTAAEMAHERNNAVVAAADEAMQRQNAEIDAVNARAASNQATLNAAQIASE